MRAFAHTAHPEGKVGFRAPILVVSESVNWTNDLALIIRGEYGYRCNEGTDPETSPQVYARIGGVLYLIIIVIGFFSEFFVRDKLVVSGDVTATSSLYTLSASAM